MTLYFRDVYDRGYVGVEFRDSANSNDVHPYMFGPNALASLEDAAQGKLRILGPLDDLDTPPTEPSVG